MKPLGRTDENKESAVGTAEATGMTESENHKRTSEILFDSDTSMGVDPILSVQDGRHGWGCFVKRAKGDKQRS